MEAGTICSGFSSCLHRDDFKRNGFAADQPVEIKIGYLRQVPSKIRISLIDVPAANDGLAGAQLATEDDNATGRFLNQHYTLVEKSAWRGRGSGRGNECARGPGNSFIVTSLDADRLLKVADAGQARGETLINASALDERLREQDCRANVIHVAPTRSMLADALAQYLIWKKWDKWVLLKGRTKRMLCSPKHCVMPRPGSAPRSSRSGSSRIVAGRDAPIAVSPRSSDRCRW